MGTQTQEAKSKTFYCGHLPSNSLHQKCWTYPPCSATFRPSILRCIRTSPWYSSPSDSSSRHGSSSTKSHRPSSRASSSRRSSSRWSPPSSWDSAPCSSSSGWEYTSDDGCKHLMTTMHFTYCVLAEDFVSLFILWHEWYKHG